MSDIAIMPIVEQENQHVTSLQIVRSYSTSPYPKSVFLRTAEVAIRDVNGDGKGDIFTYGAVRNGNYGAYVYVFDHAGNLLWEFDG